jgi:hypothetical protein
MLLAMLIAVYRLSLERLGLAGFAIGKVLAAKPWCTCRDDCLLSHKTCVVFLLHLQVSPFPFSFSEAEIPICFVERVFPTNVQG